MPNYHLEYYTELDLDIDATYQEVIDRHAELIKYTQDNCSTDISVKKINVAKDRLTKLLRPMKLEERILIIDFDLTITKCTSIKPEYLNHCDDSTLLNNIRNPNEFKKLVLTAIELGHRIAIATFNEYKIMHQNKNIYLVRRFLLALFDEEIVSQIWIAAKNNNADKDKSYHILQIKKALQANISQMVMIDDDTSVLNTTKKKFKNKLMTLHMPVYETNDDYKHLNLIHLLILTLRDNSFLKYIPQIINVTDRYLEICNLKTNDQRKVLELFSKYIAKYFDHIHPRIKFIGLIHLINNHQICTVNELFTYDSFKLALCSENTISDLLDYIINTNVLPITSVNNWNKETLIHSLIKARNGYISKCKPENIVILPLAKLIHLTTFLQSQELAEFCFTLLSPEDMFNVFDKLLAEYHWKMAVVLLKMHNLTMQKLFKEREYPAHLQNIYHRFPRKIMPLSSDQQIVGKQLLMVLKTSLQQYDSTQKELAYFHYLTLEITYGDPKDFSNTLNLIGNSPAAMQIKNQLFIGMLSKVLLPVSCEKNTALLKPWFVTLLTNGIDLKINDNDHQNIINDILLFNDADIFDLLYKHLTLPPIDINFIKFCFNCQLHTLALHLLAIIDFKNLDKSYISNLIHIDHLTLTLIKNIHSLVKSRGMQLPSLNLREILLNAINRGNIRRVKEILESKMVLIDQSIILAAIDAYYADILALLIQFAIAPIDYPKMLHYICNLEINAFNSSIFLIKSTRCNLLRTVILHSNIIDLNIKNSDGTLLLHRLIELHDIDSIELLIRLGCNPLLTDSHNRTALIIAQQLYNAVVIDSDEDNLNEDEQEDYFTHDLADVGNAKPASFSASQTNLASATNKKFEDYRDQIITLLAQAENKHKTNSVLPSSISQLYHLIESNLLNSTLQFLDQNISLKSMLSEKENPLGFDLLNIVIFKTQNSLMLKALLSAGISIQISEPPINRTLAQLINHALCSSGLNKNIYFEFLEILCGYLFKNTHAKKIFSDIGLLRMVILLAAQDTQILGSGLNLVDKFVSIVGVELFYQPLLTENISDDQHQFLIKIRDMYPPKMNDEPTLINNTMPASIPTNTAESSSIFIPATTHSNSSSVFLEITDAEKIINFSSLFYGPQQNNDKKRKSSLSGNLSINIIETPTASGVRIDK